MQATSNEWSNYYARADEMRARVGDPFLRLLRRQAFRARALRVCGIVVVTVAIVVLLALLFELLQDLRFD